MNRWGYLDKITPDESYRRLKRCKKGEDLCEECSLSVFGESAHTGKDGRIHLICALSQSWHPSCFFCDVCETPIKFDIKGNSFYLFGSNAKEDKELHSMTTEDADKSGYPCCKDCYEKNPDPFGTQKVLSLNKTIPVDGKNRSLSLSDGSEKERRPSILKEESESSILNSSAGSDTNSLKKKLHELSFNVNKKDIILVKQKRINGLRFKIRILEQCERIVFEAEDPDTKDIHVVSYSFYDLKKLNFLSTDEFPSSPSERESLANILYNALTINSKGELGLVAGTEKIFSPPSTPDAATLASLKERGFFSSKDDGDRDEPLSPKEKETSDERERRLRPIQPLQVTSTRLSITSEKWVEKHHKRLSMSGMLSPTPTDTSKQTFFSPSIMSPMSEEGKDGSRVEKRKMNRRRSSLMQGITEEMKEGARQTIRKKSLKVLSESKNIEEEYISMLSKYLSNGIDNRRDFLSFSKKNCGPSAIRTTEFLLSLLEYKFDSRPSAKIRAAKCGEIYQKYLKNDTYYDYLEISLKLFKHLQDIVYVNSHRNASPDVALFDDFIDNIISNYNKKTLIRFLRLVDSGEVFSPVTSPPRSLSSEKPTEYVFDEGHRKDKAKSKLEDEDVCRKALSSGVSDFFNLLRDHKRDVHFTCTGLDILREYALTSGGTKEIVNNEGIQELLDLLDRTSDEFVEKYCYRVLYTLSKYDFVATLIEEDRKGGYKTLQLIRKFGHLN